MSVQQESAKGSSDAKAAHMSGADSDSNSTDKSASALNKQDESAEDSEASENSGEGSEESESNASNDEDSDSDSQSKDQDKSGKKMNGLNKKFKKLTSKLSAKEQEAEFWKAEALKNRRQDEAASAKPSVQEPDKSKPDPNKFTTYEEYVDALTDWKIEQKEALRESKTKDAQVKTAHQKSIETHQERVRAFAETHKDFSDLMEDVDHVPMSVAVQEVILESENGPELMYRLAKDPERFEKICAMNPLAAARELGKIEAQIEKSSNPEKEPKKLTSAPKPIEPLGGSSKGASTKQLDDPHLSFADFVKLRRAQSKRR